jgi:hypothetical protein
LSDRRTPASTKRGKPGPDRRSATAAVAFAESAQDVSTAVHFAGELLPGTDRLYFRFGPPIATTPWSGRADEPTALAECRDAVKVPGAQAQRPLPRGAAVLGRQPHLSARRRAGHWWPSHTQFLDFELELACVLAKPIADATPQEALDVIGGWFVLNDWSARDVQADDARRNIFGPVVKSKTFANSIGCDVLTADALPDWTRATGRVRVDGEVWCEGSAANPQRTLGAMLAYCCAGEKLDAGDVLSMGTIPGCCGLELDRWIKPGQTVQRRVRAAAAPARAQAHGWVPVPADRPPRRPAAARLGRAHRRRRGALEKRGITRPSPAGGGRLPARRWCPTARSLG